MLYMAEWAQTHLLMSLRGVMHTNLSCGLRNPKLGQVTGQMKATNRKKKSLSAAAPWGEGGGK